VSVGGEIDASAVMSDPRNVRLGSWARAVRCVG
jgi:hypothetical protein